MPASEPPGTLDAASHVAGLTMRQHQIMDLVLAGHPSKNIAADLGISQRTVENHRAAIMKRTGSKSLPALARLAVAADGRDADGPTRTAVIIERGKEAQRPYMTFEAKAASYAPDDARLCAGIASIPSQPGASATDPAFHRSSRTCAKPGGIVIREPGDADKHQCLTMLRP